MKLAAHGGNCISLSRIRKLAANVFFTSGSNGNDVFLEVMTFVSTNVLTDWRPMYSDIFLPH